MIKKSQYTSVHNWLYKYHGKAFICFNNSEHSGPFEWANISGNYKRDVYDYKQLCISCHRKEDYYKRNGNKCLKGHDFTYENTYIMPDGRRKCKICRRKVFRDFYYRKKLKNES